MSSEEIICDSSIDAVIIGTPTTTHYDLIHEAAANGKAIFCEKPVDLSVERIRECMVAVEKAGVPFMTAFNRRFDPSFANLKEKYQIKLLVMLKLLLYFHETHLHHLLAILKHQVVFLEI